MKIEEIDFKALKHVTLVYITKELLENNIVMNDGRVDYSLHCRFMSDEITARISQRFATRHECDVEFRWYLSWWQELRAKILPNWWLRKYPSRREIKETRRVSSVYPSIRLGGVEHHASINEI